ncbi:hypothetical protein SAMN04488007_0295 [Maribacter aquivivus]|uniref:YD repeat-containing protein n=1 Tax=Maribacter aquivivus TaxID=228958 RepID=A0A1M6J7B6_9FLAO|nr:hypothetical protein [Maribacter aquivivus]SHJ42586.1 hypothetical protein SAMN04488007_0295 [Maribacter aquivivus]
MTFKILAFSTFLLLSSNIFGQLKFDTDILDLNKKGNISRIELKSYNYNRGAKKQELKKTEVFTFNSKGFRVLYFSNDYLSQKDSIVYDNSNNIKEIYLFNKDGSKKERIHAFYDSQNKLNSVKYYLYNTIKKEPINYNNLHFLNETPSKNGTIQKYKFDDGIEQEFHFNKEGLMTKKTRGNITDSNYQKLEYEYSEKYDNKIKSNKYRKKYEHLLVQQFQNNCILLNSLYQDIFDASSHITQREITTIKTFQKNDTLINIDYFEYDSSGNKSKSIVDYIAADIKYSVEYKYNDKNNLIEESYIRKNGTKTYQYEYAYDSNNNWIEKTSYRKHLKRYADITKRIIVYK